MVQGERNQDEVGNEIEEEKILDRNEDSPNPIDEGFEFGKTIKSDEDSKSGEVNSTVA